MLRRLACSRLEAVRRCVAPGLGEVRLEDPRRRLEAHARRGELACSCACWAVSEVGPVVRLREEEVATDRECGEQGDEAKRLHLTGLAVWTSGSSSGWLHNER